MADTRFSDYFLTTLVADLAAYYRCDEASGSTLADSGPDSHDLTLNGTPTFGETGLLLNETNDAIGFGSASEFANGINNTDWVNDGNNVNFLTMIAIVSMDTTSQAVDFAELFVRSGPSFYPWALYSRTSNKCQFAITDIGLNLHSVISTNDIPIDRSCLLIGRASAVGNDMLLSLWVDGVKTEATITGVDTISYSGANDVVIGHNGNGVFGGIIDELIFLRRALSDTEIANVLEFYANSVPSATLSMVGQAPPEQNPKRTLRMIPVEPRAAISDRMPAGLLRMQPVLETPTKQLRLRPRTFTNVQRNDNSGRFRTVVRAYIAANGESTIELPISLWQAKHSYRYPSSITLTVPGLELETAINDRSAGTISVHYGWRDAAGNETLEELLTVAIENIDKTENANLSFLTISGSSDLANEAPKTYPLGGATTIQAKDEFVTYTLPAEPFIKPADLVTFPDATELAVGEITYSGTAISAQMSLVAADDINLFADETDPDPEATVTYGFQGSTNFRIVPQFPWSRSFSS